MTVVCSLQGFDDDDAVRGAHPAHILGLQMIYHLQALQSVDTLMTYHKKREIKVASLPAVTCTFTLYFDYSLQTTRTKAWTTPNRWACFTTCT